MRLNKNFQYALLFTLYIVRGGRVAVKHAAESLNLSESLLTQVAHKLKKAGIVKSVRGPGGGYELIGDPTVRDVLAVIGSFSPLTLNEISEYKASEIEGRALLFYAQKIYSSLYLQFSRKKIRELITDMVTAEMLLNGTKEINV